MIFFMIGAVPRSVPPKQLLGMLTRPRMCRYSSSCFGAVFMGDNCISLADPVIDRAGRKGGRVGGLGKMEGSEV